MLVFRLGRAAPVEFMVVQVAPDCRHIGRFRVAGHPGVNRVRFRGHIGGRALDPGTYRIKARTLPRGRAVVDTKFVVVERPERRVIVSSRGADACGSRQDSQSPALQFSGSARETPKAAAAPARVKAVNDKREGVVFILWGEDARKKEKLIDGRRHSVIKSSHPSPLSAWRGFLESSPFSDANKELTRLGRGEIDWERVGRDA